MSSKASHGTSPNLFHSQSIVQMFRTRETFCNTKDYQVSRYSPSAFSSRALYRSKASIKMYRYTSQASETSTCRPSTLINRSTYRQDEALPTFQERPNQSLRRELSNKVYPPRGFTQNSEQIENLTCQCSLCTNIPTFQGDYYFGKVSNP